ncbi:MAG: ATP-dependent DNA helicase RecG [Actinobacteria bacterium]|nr:ATP-dependent DNA helicase RecG [Actinomycetota bacterium]
MAQVRPAEPSPAPGGGGPITVAELDALGVERLRSPGARRVEAMGELGLHSVWDLLTHYPRRYIDRSRQAVVRDLRVGEEAMVLVRIGAASTRRSGRRAITTVHTVDGEGDRLRLTFFNQPWRERQLTAGTEAVVFGRLERFRDVAGMTAPIVDLVGDRTGRIVPVYPQSERVGLSTWDIGRAVEEVLRRAAPRGFADPLDETARRRLGMVDRGAALVGIHTPAAPDEAAAARRRLTFDELLRMQVALLARKRRLEASAIGRVQRLDGPLVRRLLDGLPFPLTGAQRRVLGEIDADLARPVPMHRLLQGDVGAGKTVVAVAAMLGAVDSGNQALLMVPTEVLAEQHAAAVRGMVEGLTVEDHSTLTGTRPLRVDLLTNRTPAGERRRILAGLRTGDVEVVVGTHALIGDAVTVARPGVVVIDEQHRFGVEQRAALLRRSADDAVPDVLVMTATPIPRTAAMTVYGDLDVSVLNELPPGRTPITTTWARTPEEVASAWATVRAAVTAGRQAYVVTPLVEDSEKSEVASAERTRAELADDELLGLRVGLLHGRVPAAERLTVMDDFRLGRIDVLVATTVIEVGVDVPNATVVVILDADRFGIAQLHQLRGRVGRGVHASTCILVAADDDNPTAAARLGALVRTTDGFELAEVDLDLRGEGTVMGERQKGRSDLKLASLRRDRALVELAREVAGELVGPSGELAAIPLLAEEVAVVLGEEAVDFLAKS